MATNDFLPFATATGANVTAQTTYKALPAVGSGFQSGVAQSDQVNKVLRQATVFASAMATFINSQANLDTLDDGDVAGLANKILTAIQTVSGAAAGGPYVRQGTGVGQLTNTIKIGWSSASKLKATVDVTDIGNLALETWVASQLGNYQLSTNNFSTLLVYNASSSLTVPANVTKMRVRAWGAGGSGGGSSDMAYPGGGGGAGGYGEGIYTVTPGQVIPITIGVGTAALAGGTSSFGTLLTASGGSAGGAGSTGNVGLGGSGGGPAGQQFGVVGGTGSSGIIYAGSSAVEGGTGAGSFGSTIVRAVATNNTQFSANPGVRPGGGSTGCTYSTAPGGNGLITVEF